MGRNCGGNRIMSLLGVITATVICCATVLSSYEYEVWAENRQGSENCYDDYQNITDIRYSDEDEDAPAHHVVVYRMYNRNSGEHFYTINSEEKKMLIDAGWRYEGHAWYAPEMSGTPVFRLYNLSAGEHHYTASLTERNYLAGIGWIDEGISFYSEEAYPMPVLRSYNPNQFANNHNYTVNEIENGMLINLGWKTEEFAFCAYDETKNR